MLARSPSVERETNGGPGEGGGGGGGFMAGSAYAVAAVQKNCMDFMLQMAGRPLHLSTPFSAQLKPPYVVVHL